MKNSRTKFLLISIYLVFALILAKLFYIQIISGQQLRDQAVAQIYKLEKIPPQQGDIFSSDNYPLSLDYSFFRLALYKPNFKNDLEETLSQINTVKPEFATQNATLIEKFKNPAQKWLEFKSEFSLEEKNQLESLPGLSFSLAQKRFYPQKDLGLPLILGLERYYQRELAGQAGFKRSIIDGTGSDLLTRKNWQKNEIDGRDIHTSLNRQIQLITEDVLKRGLLNYQADQALGIVLNPQKGEIISMAAITATPSADFAAILNIAHLFEPGSIFKPLVMAAALDTNSINSNFTCGSCRQPRQVGEFSINNWDSQVHPDSTLKDIIKNSDNIGMSYIIDQLGLDKFLDYFTRLKLNQKTGIDLTGESISPLKSYWSKIDFLTASFGQGFALNQLQMIQAFNALANHGQLVKVHFNQGVKPETTQVFSQKATTEMIDILRYAVENSPVATYKPKDFEVCAKSGTSQVAHQGEYGQQVDGSYIGFFPCNNPKATIIVTLFNPKNGQWGSATAAPLWFELAQKISPLL